MGAAGLEGPPEEGAPWDEWVERGWALEDAPHPIAELDGIDDPEERPEGEHPGGVSISRHPYVSTLEEPRIAAIWDRWRCGLRTIDRGAYCDATSFELDCLIELSQAQAREDARAMRRRTEATTEGSDDDG